ncbi:MAG: hypothetical protein KDI07_24555 [Anaerolineae bacterium]|nr:hypothetical protein [Anaerolineae bacterium]
MKKSQLLAVGSTVELEPAAGCDACKRLQTWARTAWARGHKMGMQENERIARDAVDALLREKDAHAETNARMTDSLMQAEDSAAEAIRRLRTLLSDIKTWDVDQYMRIPHDLRVRMQKEIGDGK